MVTRGHLDGKTNKIKRLGLVGTFAAAMLLVLAACGSTQEVPSATDQAAAVVTEPTPTETVSEAVATESHDMTGMVESTPTPAEALADASSAATDTPAAGSRADGSAGNVVEIQATLREWAIDLSQQEVAAGTVRFVVTNQGQFNHNLAVTDSSGTIAKTITFGAGDGPQTLEVDLQPGTYTIICDLPGHAGRGQMAQLVVK